MFYCYLYCDPSRNNEPIYVGMGSKKRAWDHLKRKDNAPFPNRVKKMLREGIQPLIEFLVKDCDKELAQLVEVEAIDKFGRKDLGKGTLLNLTNGGDGCLELSAETRKKMGAASLGRRLTEEHRIKTSETLKMYCLDEAVRSERRERAVDLIAAGKLTPWKGGKTKGMTGRKHSDETIVKMKASALNRKKAA